MWTQSGVSIFMSDSYFYLSTYNWCVQQRFKLAYRPIYPYRLGEIEKLKTKTFEFDKFTEGRSAIPLEGNSIAKRRWQKEYQPTDSIRKRIQGTVAIAGTTMFAASRPDIWGKS